MKELKEMRLALKMSQEQFANYFGISRRTYQNWELENSQESRKCPQYVIDLMKYKIKNEMEKGNL